MRFGQFANRKPMILVRFACILSLWFMLAIPSSSKAEDELYLAPLYLGWSGERNDTRTQKGDTFENMYTQEGGQLGWIWTEASDGMIPLYQCWDGGRKNTITSSDKTDCEGSNVTNTNIIGYIYSSQADSAMKQLWKAYSDDRKDDRTQASDEFESMYSNKKSQGWIRDTGDIVYVGIKFDMDSASVEQNPANITQGCQNNNTDGADSFDVAYEKSLEEVATFTWSDAIKVGVKITAGFSVPLVADVGFDLSAENTYTFGETNTINSGQYTTETYYFEVPAGECIKGTVVTYNGNIDVSYVATLGIDGTDITWEEDGTYEGVNYVKAVGKSQDCADPKEDCPDVE